MSHHAPLQIVSALASDQPEVAALVLARSPLLTDADLIDRVAARPEGDAKTDRRPAGRLDGGCQRPSPRSASRKPAPRCSPIAAPTSPRSASAAWPNGTAICPCARGTDHRCAAACRLPAHAAGQARRNAEDFAAGHGADGRGQSRPRHARRLRQGFGDADRRHAHGRTCGTHRASAAARRSDRELHHPHHRAWQGRFLRLGAGRAQPAVRTAGEGAAGRRPRRGAAGAVPQRRPCRRHRTPSSCGR